VTVFSLAHTRQGSFQILKRLFSDKAETIPHLTLNGLGVHFAANGRDR